MATDLTTRNGAAEMAEELATWDAARAAWNFSLGTHDHGGQDYCDCQYTWACPTCGQKVSAMGYEIGQYEREDGKCLGCSWA